MTVYTTYIRLEIDDLSGQYKVANEIGLENLPPHLSDLYQVLLEEQDNIISAVDLINSKSRFTLNLGAIYELANLKKSTLVEKPEIDLEDIVVPRAE